MNSGAFGENFPYSNFHDLNMDWIIKIAKDFLDQYTHIQEVIANGEQSLSSLTADGLEQLQTKADALEALLQQWYDTHSQDIANQLAQALSGSITAFYNAADQKAQETIASIPADYTTLSNKVTELGNDLDYVTNYLSSDLLLGKTATENWFVDPETGVGRTFAQFYSYENVEIPEGTVTLWPMNDIDASNRYIRSVCFFDDNGTFISGVSGINAQVTYGISVPASARTLSATLTYLNAVTKTKAEHYLSTIKGNTSIVDEKIDSLQQAINDIVDETHTDLLYGLTPIERWFVDPETGVGRTIAQFYSYENVEIPEGTDILWPMNDIDASNRYIRSVCFFDDNGTFISGVSGINAQVTYGISVPASARTLSATLTYLNDGTKAEHYLSTRYGGNYTTKILNDSIKVKASQILDLDITKPVQLPNRKPTFAFVFDDGTDGDINIKALFDSYGFKCGFALIGETAYLRTRKDRYLTYQNEGFEILSHSVNGTPFSGITDLETTESYLKNSLTTLATAGFNITGWVTPSTLLLEEQLPLVEKYYQYGYGHVTGTSENINHTFIGIDIRQLDRWSLESKTVEETLAAIDNTITNNRYMIFYGHSYPAIDNNLTVANMATILSYLKTRVDNGQIMVDTPRNTINNFYMFRHSDLLDLYNSINN